MEKLKPMAGVPTGVRLKFRKFLIFVKYFYFKMIILKFILTAFERNIIFCGSRVGIHKT